MVTRPDRQHRLTRALSHPSSATTRPTAAPLIHSPGDVAASARPAPYVAGVTRASDLTEGGTSRNPNVGLPAVAALRRLVERLEDLQVANARTLGWSWAAIATALGVSKQTVHRKHAPRRGAGR